MRTLPRVLAALALFIAVTLGGASPALACGANQQDCGGGPHPNTHSAHP